MSIAAFKVFRDIAQAHSISRAAELNEISQSAASQHLKTLEKKLGAELVDRRTRPLKLTSAGRIYYEASRDIVRRYEQMEAELESLRSELAGAVRVASIYSIGLYEMTRLRDAFQAENPQAHVHLEFMRPDKIYQAVQDDQADFGLVSYPNPGKELRTINWRLERLALVCLPDHPLARKKTVRPGDLAGEDFVSFDPGLSIRRVLDRFFREHGVHRQIALEADNVQMIKEAVLLGSGVSILPEQMVAQEAAEGRVVVRQIEADGLIRPVGIILRRKKRLTRTAAQFLQFLQAHAAPEKAA